MCLASIRFPFDLLDIIFVYLILGIMLLSLSLMSQGSVPNRDLVTQRGDLVIRGSQDLVRDLLTQDKVSSDCNSSGFDSLLGRLLGNSVPDNNSISKERDRNLNDSSKLLGNNQVGNSTSRCLGGRLSPLPRWSHLLAWVLCLALGLSSLVVTIVLGIRLVHKTR